MGSFLEGGSWKSNRFGLEDGTTHGTNPRCKSGGAGDASRTAEELRQATRRPRLGLCTCCSFCWNAVPSNIYVASSSEFRTQLRHYFIKHTFLDRQKYLASPHLSLYVISLLCFYYS